MASPTTATEIQMLKAAGELKINSWLSLFNSTFAKPLMESTMESVFTWREKGYSQSHWRKIIKERKAQRIGYFKWKDSKLEIML